MYGGDQASGGDMDFRAPGTNRWMLWDESLGKWTVSTGIGAKTLALTIDASQDATFAGALAVAGAVTGVTTLSASGDVTGATMAATGDTAAGDNASMGYTADEGLILTGQGVTNDVTIKNDADADVLEIPTGTTNVNVAGDMTATGNISGAEVQVSGTDIFETIYPVGTIYQSTVSTNPATLFGVGTWTALEDRFLIGESATYAAASTGGQADAIVPNHTHPMKGTQTVQSGSGINVHAAAGTGLTTGAASSGESVTNANLPPYLAVYMWERTA
jgi:hypothetical protein